MREYGGECVPFRHIHAGKCRHAAFNDWLFEQAQLVPFDIQTASVF